MTPADFPLCKAAGLKVLSIRSSPSGLYEDYFVSAADVERWLEQAPVVYGHWDGRVFTVPDPRLGLKSGTSTPDTHTARLVCIQPLVQDTAESLLRELVDNLEAQANYKQAVEIVKRAKALLEGK